VFLNVDILKYWQLMTLRFQARPIIRWWESRHRLRLDQQAERVRDSLMQDMFIIRRKVELLHNRQDEVDDLLQQVAHLHQGLEHLTEILSPPYVEDSLPLAIQNLIHQQSDLGFAVTMSFSGHDHHGSPTDNLTMVLMLAEFIGFATSATTTQALHVHLTHHPTKGNVDAVLGLDVIYQDSQTCKTVQASTELLYLYQAFRLLMAGQCTQDQHGNIGQWRFRWRLRPQDQSGVNLGARP
jgi:hypothetical protein